MSREVVEGREHHSVAGEERARILAEALDYRGDVTLRLASGETIEGYIFADEPGLPDPVVRLFPSARDEKVAVRHDDIVGISFSGKDMAFGRSWEAWVERHERARAHLPRGEHPGD